MPSVMLITAVCVQYKQPLIRSHRYITSELLMHFSWGQKHTIQASWCLSDRGSTSIYRARSPTDICQHTEFRSFTTVRRTQRGFECLSLLFHFNIPSVLFHKTTIRLFFLEKKGKKQTAICACFRSIKWLLTSFVSGLLFVSVNCAGCGNEAKAKGKNPKACSANTAIRQDCCTFTHTASVS